MSWRREDGSRLTGYYLLALQVRDIGREDGRSTALLSPWSDTAGEDGVSAACLSRWSDTAGEDGVSAACLSPWSDIAG